MADSRAELTFAGPAGPQCLDQLHDLLAQLWAQHPGVSEVDQMMFTTAVLEISNNILTHGEPTTLWVVVAADPGQLEAQLSDDGTTTDADPAAAVLPDELCDSGRGLAMVRMAVDEVRYEHAGGRNHWYLLRRRDA